MRETSFASSRAFEAPNKLAGNLNPLSIEATDNFGNVPWRISPWFIATAPVVALDMPVIYYLFGDHLGSNSMTLDLAGEPQGVARYLPYGQPRAIKNTLLTDKTFTGQREEDFGLMDYNARYFSPLLGRFVSADSIIPGANNPLAWDRYLYGLGNPIKYSDPSGHSACWDGDANDIGCANYWRQYRVYITKPPIISRSEWGAHEPGSFGNQTPGAENYEGLYPDSPDGYKLLDDPSGSYVGIAIHHEGDDETFDPKRVQEAEMNVGFYDIGYHYVIGRDGTIYEGRNVNVRGNAAYPNSQNISILWLGDFNPGYEKNDPLGRYGQADPGDWIPTQEQYEATADLVKWLDIQYGITAIWGHRDVPGGFGTVCPGDNAMPLINRLKEAFEK